MNTITCIGYIGCQVCYLNISEQEAIELYCEQQKLSKEEFDALDFYIYTMSFDKQFAAYDIWEDEPETYKDTEDIITEKYEPFKEDFELLWEKKEKYYNFENWWCDFLSNKIYQASKK